MILSLPEMDVERPSGALRIAKVVRAASVLPVQFRLLHSMVARACVFGAALLCVTAVATPIAAKAPSVSAVIASPAVLGRMFTNVCVASGDATRVEAALGDVGMAYNPETGTFFHQLFDMSVNATGGGCAMVFVTNLDDDTAMAPFRTSMVQTHGGDVPAMSMTVRESDGESDVRARIEVIW